MSGTATQFVRGGANTNLIPQVWETVDFEYAFKKIPLTKWMSQSGSSYGDSIIVVTRELAKGKGDKITIPLRQPVLDDGQSDDGDYDGNYKKIDFLNSDVYIYERGITLAVKGQKTIQINYHGSDLAGGVTRMALDEWIGTVMYSDLVCAMSGIPAVSIASGFKTGVKAVDVDSNPIKTVNCYTPLATATGAAEYAAWYTSTKGVTHPRIFCGGQDDTTGLVQRVAADANITAWSTGDYRFGTAVITYVKNMAQNISAPNSSGTEIMIPPLEPIGVNGVDYIIAISQEQANDLMADPVWIESHQQLDMSGEGSILFQGGLGKWNGVVPIVVDRIHKRKGAGGTTTGITAREYFDGIPYSATYTSNRDQLASGVEVARAVLLGKAAVVQAWGANPVFTEGFIDSASKTKPSMHTHAIYGVKTPTFAFMDTRAGGEDTKAYPYASILVDTAIQPIA